MQDFFASFTPDFRCRLRRPSDVSSNLDFIRLLRNLISSFVFAQHAHVDGLPQLAIPPCLPVTPTSKHDNIQRKRIDAAFGGELLWTHE